MGHHKRSTPGPFAKSAEASVTCSRDKVSVVDESTIISCELMMGLKGLISIFWLFHCLAVVLAERRQFTGSGYLEYNIVSNKNNEQINTRKYMLNVEFRTVQPSGLIFHARSAGGIYSDYITLEVVGGRLRYAFRYGYRQSNDDKHEVYLGKDLDKGKTNTVKVDHNDDLTTIVLDEGSTGLKTKREIRSLFKMLDVDIAIYVGGAPDFSALRSVKSDAMFMGCLTNVEFDPKTQNQGVIKFLNTAVTTAFPSDMDKDCSAQTYDPFTFTADDSSLVCAVEGLSGKTTLEGSFLFRTYKDAGTLLKQINGDNKFQISYTTRRIQLLVSIESQGLPKRESVAAISYSQDDLITMNNGNWHLVRFTISTTTVKLTVGSRTVSSTPLVIPNDFFVNNVMSGGFIGCMRDLKLNNVDCKKSKVSENKVELNSCNITDFCVFSPCLHGGMCDQTGKSFSCQCATTGYEGPVCQFSEYELSCENLKWKLKTLNDKNYPLDFDGPGPIKPKSVFCNFTAKPATTRILSTEAGIKLQPSMPQPISQRITYEHGLEAAEALAKHSERCVQYIEFGCKRAKLLGDGQESLGYWVSADGVYRDYWGGAPPGVRACACHKSSSCLGGKKCNCDAAENIWTADEGYLNSTTLLPVEEVVFAGVVSPGEANFTVGHLYCSGNTSNTATFVNEDGFITLPKWSPPSDGVIQLNFRTPYAKGTILYNGVTSGEYFRLQIVNETTVSLIYNIGNGARNIELSLVGKQVNDRSYHTVTIYHNMKEFGLMLDDLKSTHQNPLFLKRDLDLENKLYVGSYPYDPTEGFVGCIRGLVINGEVQDLSTLAIEAAYVKSGCGAACESNACRQGGKCLDNYNVYFCDCSKTPFHGYFCHEDKGASFDEDNSQLIYTYPTPESVPNVDIVLGFKVKDRNSCGGDLIRIDSKDTEQYFLLSLVNSGETLRFSFMGPGGPGSFDATPQQGLDFCSGRHTFALSRRGQKINYTVDGVKQPIQETDRLNGLFSKMENITVGSKGFKGCITGVKVTQGQFGSKPSTVEPIKDYVYEGKTDGFTATGLTRDSKAKCGPEPDVPEIPTPRPVGGSGDLTTPLPSTPDNGKRAQANNRTAIIVVVVLILVLLLVVLVIVIYWYWARHKGEYHTHEDDEDLKGADPYIDLTAPRKPQGEETEKKKEWYI